MILQSRFAPHASIRSKVIIALLAFLVLPLFVQSTTTKALADSNGEASRVQTDETETQTTSELPYVVKFQQGAMKFDAGDDITVVEIRGTAKTFQPGNLYWIKGTYALASQNQAMLAAYTTAWNAADGTGRSFVVQKTNIKKGEGTFMLYLPMLCNGWPHVSFYGDGGSFGGNYFGTDDTVMKEWWGSKQSDKPASSTANENRAKNTLEFPYKVQFEQGATQFLAGDNISIDEIRGTSETFTPGNTYRIKGTYSLASNDDSTLAAYITASDAANARSKSRKVQRTLVKRGDGTFTLILPMSYEGWPHVSFYPRGGGSSLGGNYFGTGDSVLKQWWGSK